MYPTYVLYCISAEPHNSHSHRRDEKNNLEVDQFMIKSAVRARAAAELLEMQAVRNAQLVAQMRAAAALPANGAQVAVAVPMQ